jgi:multicomponent K+:H+ antiporter subunit E
MSLMLLAVWLLLNNTLAPGQILLGVVLAIVVPMVTERFRPERPRLRRPSIAMRLLVSVLWDILLSNIEVARRILGPESAIHPGFVWIPLDIRDASGIAALAAIITLTPGTLSVDLSEDRQHLLVHALDVGDRQTLVARIKGRYERPLMEIFS